MGGFHIVSLSIALAALACSLSAAAEEKGELATEVCKNTTDFGFCRSAVYSDPRAPTADRYDLIDIVYRKTWSNATDTKNYIDRHMKSGSEISLKKCAGNYKEAIQKLTEMLGNLDSESYYELDIMSLDVERSVQNCKKVLQRSSIIYWRNENMLKLANICYVVSKLFHYN